MSQSSLRRVLFATAAALAFGLAAPGAIAATDTAAPAAETAADPAHVWDLSALYASPEDWRTAYDDVLARVGSLGAYQGKLTESAAGLKTALDAGSALYKDALRVLVYAALKADEDLRSAPDQERRQLAGRMMVEIGKAVAYVQPELIAAGPEKLRAFLAEEPGLAPHRMLINGAIRSADHTLGIEAEQVMAAAGNVLMQPGRTYGLLANADLPYPTVTLSTGEEVRINQSAYTKYRQAPDRGDRKLVFDAFWGKWKEYENTMGGLLGADVTGNVFVAETRNYSSALAAALHEDAMPEAVYRTLVAEVNAALPTLHRYFKLRKMLLGITDDMGYHDIYPPMVSLDKRYTVEDSKRLTLAAAEPLGEDYLAHLRTGFDGRWMHVYPQPGKTSGAYMFGAAFDVHPFILLNHNDDYQGLSTFAHEWGHAVHTMYTKENQPFELSNYSTFTAETAAIIVEMLLQEHQIANAATKEEKLFYLGEALEALRGTYFRQTKFAEFELAIHEEVEAGRPLTGARMTEIYCDLLKRYHGHDQGVVVIDPAYCIEWAYIPHFYRAFYVFQYSTSIAGAAYFTEQILKEGAPARDRFIAMLKAGGSDYPYALYKQAGLDMATPEPYRALERRMNAIMDQMEAILAEE